MNIEKMIEVQIKKYFAMNNNKIEEFSRTKK